MRFKSLLLLGMISISPISYAASTEAALTEPTRSSGNPYSQEAMHRMKTNTTIHESILLKLSNLRDDLESSASGKFVGVICGFSKSIQEFLLTAGAMILEQQTGKYLGLGSGDGYFEDLLNSYFPEITNWHTTVTDGSEANVKKIKHANETFALDVNELEKSRLRGKLQGQTFDIISVQNVFQFLSENERMECLHNLSKLLNPNGVILLSYEQLTIQRAPRKMQEQLTLSISNKVPGVYAYQYSLASNSIHYFDQKNGGDFFPLDIIISNPQIQTLLRPLPKPDDLSVQDAIIITGHDGVKAKLHRGKYPKDLPGSEQIIEFAIVYRAIDFRQFPELEVQKSGTGVKYNSVSGTVMEDMLIESDPEMKWSLDEKAEWEKGVTPAGVFQVLRKKPAAS